MGTVFHLKKEGKPDKDGNPRGCWRYEDKLQGARDTLNERFAYQIKRLREGGVTLDFEDIVDQLLQLKDSDNLQGTITFKSFSEEFMNCQKIIKENRSVGRSRYCLKQFIKLFGHKRMGDITPQDINEYKERRKCDGLKINSVRRELAVISALFNYAIRSDKFTGQNPVKKVGIEFEDDKRKRVLEPEEEKKLLKVSPEPLKSIILVGLYTGMRANEIVSLEWDWINFRENEINIPAAVVKSKKDRSVPMNKDIKSLLLAMKLKSFGTQFVFPSPTKSGFHLLNPKRAWKEACAQAGIKNLRFHDLRRTFGTRLCKSGVPVQVVKELLGHSDISVTMRYVISDKPEVQGAIDLLRFTYFERNQDLNENKIRE